MLTYDVLGNICGVCFMLSCIVMTLAERCLVVHRVYKTYRLGNILYKNLSSFVAFYDLLRFAHL